MQNGERKRLCDWVVEGNIRLRPPEQTYDPGGIRRLASAVGLGHD